MREVRFEVRWMVGLNVQVGDVIEYCLGFDRRWEPRPVGPFKLVVAGMGHVDFVDGECF